MDYFTSDTHFGHRNVIRYCRRPFLKDLSVGYDVDDNLDVELMDENIVQNWNATVKPQDHVFHLGDFAMGHHQDVRVGPLRARLNGQITLVRGNHDKKASFYDERGFKTAPYVLVADARVLGGGRIMMRHHPGLQEIYRAQKADEVLPFDAVLCGHVHDKWSRVDVQWGKDLVQVINVGVDVRGFRPVTLEELLATPPDSSGVDWAADEAQDDASRTRGGHKR